MRNVGFDFQFNPTNKNSIMINKGDSSTMHEIGKILYPSKFDIGFFNSVFTRSESEDDWEERIEISNWY